MKNLFLLVLILCSSTVFSQGWVQQPSVTTNTYWGTSFIDSLTGWAVGGGIVDATIAKTTNGGLNWVLQTSPVSNGLNACKFVNANTGWITTEGGGILKTTNGGSLYFQQTSGVNSPLYCVFFIDDNTGWVGGQSGKILKTTNGGNNWFSQNTGTSFLFSGILFLNPQLGYAVGNNVVPGIIYKTTNGGTNWNALTIPTINGCEEIYFINDNTGWASANNGVVIKTTNGGISWTQHNVGFSIYNVFDLYFLNSLTGWACGGEYSGSTSIGGIWKTTNGGLNWNTQLNGMMTISFAFITDNIAYAVGFGGTIYKTITGGETIPLAPTLLSPANNSTNVSLTPTLFWNTSANATSYKVIVSSMITFGNIVDSATVTTNQRTIPSGKLNVATTFYWKVLANNQYGSSPWSDAWYFSTVITGITKINSEIPSSFSVSQNYPNPFNPITKIEFAIPKSSGVKITVYDIAGKEVEVLVNEHLQAGTYQTDWNASANPSGVYFYRIQAGAFLETKRMTLIK